MSAEFTDFMSAVIAVWRLSDGKFQLFLPQSRELRELDRPDVKAYTRNTDLLEVVQADITLARFDGLELDSGTVVEFMMAKSLGKPVVILRSDFRRMYGMGLAEPYNLVVDNWPRSVAVHLDSFQLWASLFAAVKSISARQQALVEGPRPQPLRLGDASRGNSLKKPQRFLKREGLVVVADGPGDDEAAWAAKGDKDHFSCPCMPLYNGGYDCPLPSSGMPGQEPLATEMTYGRADCL